MKIYQKLVKNLKKNNVRLRASLLLYKVLLLEFFARNILSLITIDLEVIAVVGKIATIYNVSPTTVRRWSIPK